MLKVHKILRHNAGGKRMPIAIRKYGIRKTARLLNLSPSYISEWVQGKKSMRIKNYLKIVSTLRKEKLIK